MPQERDVGEWAWRRAGASLGAPKLGSVFQRPVPEAGAVGRGPRSLRPCWPACLSGFACLSEERGARTAPTLSQGSRSPREVPENGATCPCLTVGQLGFGGGAGAGKVWWDPPARGTPGCRHMDAGAHSRRGRPAGGPRPGCAVPTAPVTAFPARAGHRLRAVCACGHVRVTRGRHPARGSCQSSPASGRQRRSGGPGHPLESLEAEAAAVRAQPAVTLPA